MYMRLSLAVNFKMTAEDVINKLKEVYPGIKISVKANAKIFNIMTYKKENFLCGEHQNFLVFESSVMIGEAIETPYFNISSGNIALTGAPCPLNKRNTIIIMMATGRTPAAIGAFGRVRSLGVSRPNELTVYYSSGTVLTLPDNVLENML